MYFLELGKLESNGGHAKCLAVVEYVILICISVIVSQGVWAVSSCDCRSGLYCGREADGGKIVLNLVLAIPIGLHVSLYHSPVSIHLCYN